MIQSKKKGGADVRQQADGAWIGSATVSVTPFLVVTALGVNLSAKHIESVAHVEHGIRVDAVVSRLAPAGGIHPSLVVALLAQEVIEVEGHDEGFAFEEGLRHLSVPYQLIGVHRRVVVSTAAILVYLAAHLYSQWQAQEEMSSIVELPGIEVGIGLQLVA